MEEIADIEYGNFVSAMDRLVASPYAYKAKDFIDRYRKSLMKQTSTYDVPKLQYDENGRSFITVYGKIYLMINKAQLIQKCSFLFLECLRKSARADVTLRAPGTGKITINNEDISYFKDKQPKEQVSTKFELYFSDPKSDI